MDKLKLHVSIREPKNSEIDSLMKEVIRLVEMEQIWTGMLDDGNVAIYWEYKESKK